ncbi:DEAD/DEAH box helicase family protein [Salinisphaera sp. G21_0]|uniref:DEAD/DEAH box helicase family protein n=1 Tax=Salinisphaera sp. G21_0 TaxID=2821094 RepID=UPI001ADC2CBF|nr:DEAD/DEAH box helicase family protein [Salinisphaera sp. G21_0]MBO9484526.1 DEAD/DEAH box helicase family protein [Salinisphaera sp. G21_0]
MTPLDLETARHIIDFSGGQPALGDLGNLQLEGAVALHNMLVNPDIGMGYLADEVGMGKTYIALGVVAFLRYFNPKLKVLYICPSRNVQEKWLREYLSMTKYNIQTSHYRIRSVTGKPASPYVSCRNVPELIRTASLGHFSDIFISKSSFSISLSDDESSWVGKRESIRTLVPAHQWEGIIHSKAEVKDQYAAALNYILPTFDLVIIDEAHNFKKDANSSDRNRVLSQVLGFSDREKFQPRARNALLLSATPYDRDISQLRNQLILIGKQHLLPDNIDNNDRDSIKTRLQAFMVRRLNALKVNDTLHTRNMYRTEHRQGEQAEITLNSDEQKLVTALVQKKVGDTLTKSGSSPAFQIGMMASFESYAQTAKTEPVQFDGDETEKQQNDAMDRHVVAHIVDSFKQAGLGKTLPHPKMDSVTEQLAQKLFHQGQKQIVFVRRVKSVKELKDKLDDQYNHWLKNHIFCQLAPDSPFREIFTRLFDTYHKVSLTKDSDISEGQFVESTEGDTEDHQPAKNDTFFSWFFRGELDQAAQDIMRSGQQLLPTPDGLRKGLTAKNQVISLLLELNWARYVTEHYKDSLELLVNQHHASILALTKPHLASQLQDDLLDVYRACQIGFLQWYAEHKQQAGLLKIANALEQHLPPQHLRKAVNTEIKPGQLLDNLRLETFYTALHRYQLASDLFPLQSRVFEQLRKNLWDEELYDKLDIHVHLISLCLRTGHGVIDLYLARIRQGQARSQRTAAGAG